MNVLLDTCALLALARGELPQSAKRALRESPEACVSSVSAWEVAIQSAAGRIKLSESPIAWFLGLADRYELRELPLDSRVACAAAALPLIHKDPFDRVLVALAEAHLLAILTSDRDIPKYPGVKTVW